ELVERAQAAQTAAELANRAKDEFLAVLSHELRTPLNAMYGWARMLASGTLDEATQKRAVEVIERNIQLQSKLIEDILDVSRIVSGKIKLETRSLDLCPLIKQVAETSRPNAALKQITIETECPDGSLIVMGDSERLQQVLSNLINNAFKFTPTGGNLRIALEEIDESARISVTDSGIGIESEFLPHVFDRFKQADSSSKRHHGGLGLGLAIVKHLVELHHGSVSAFSEGKDKGATFMVELPFVKSPKTKSGTDIQSVENNGKVHDNLFEKMSVLVIEDDADAAEVLRIILSAHGAQVTHYMLALEALAALKTSNFDLILSDIGLPEMDGAEFIKTVRQAEDGRIKNLPALAVTAYASQEDTERFLDAGFNACLAKPVNFSELQSAVAKLYQRQKEIQN
ncbi:MAG: ATP-binding protein, partial [Pyrinomonadaceae bacterium]